MNVRYNLWMVLLCAGLLSLTFAACSNDSDEENKQEQTNETGTLTSVQEETEISFDEMVDIAESFDSETALPEDLDAQAENINDLIAASQELAETYSGANGTYQKNVTFKVVTINYQSIDGEGKPITLSGKLTLPLVNGKYVTIEDIVLSCHATSIPKDNKGIYSDTFKDMAAYSFAIIDPDYIGFGITYGQPQTYLCQKLIARNCVDMELAALEYMKQEGVKLKNGYGTYVTGFSQGGGNALAVGRHLQETPEGREANKSVNVKGLYCGDGPYSPIGTFNHWLKTDSLCLSAVLSMVIKGQQVGHPDIMRGISLTSYFSEEYLKSGIPQAFDSNDTNNGFGLLLGDASLVNIRWPEPETMDAYETLISLTTPWMQFSKIMSSEFADPNSHIRTALLQCLEEERVDDWTPRNMAVEIFTAPRDNVIPVEPNARAVYEKFRREGANVTYKEAGALANHITATCAWVTHVKKELRKL